MVSWLVGGKCVKGKLSKINFYQHQTLSNIKIDQYRQLFNQQKSSQASWDGSDRASEDPRFSTFWRLVRWLWLNYTIIKLQASPSLRFCPDTVCTEVSEPEWEVSNLKDGRADLSGLTTSSHYIGSRQNGLLAGRWQMSQREVVPNELLSTSDPSTHQQGAIETTFQSTKTITGVPRRSSTNPRFWLFLISVKWQRPTEAQLPTST